MACYRGLFEPRADSDAVRSEAPHRIGTLAADLASNDEECNDHPKEEAGETAAFK
jgi:hypothetical protein